MTYSEVKYDNYFPKNNDSGFYLVFALSGV